MAFCSNCGTQVADEAKFCGICGSARTAAPPTSLPPGQPAYPTAGYPTTGYPTAGYPTAGYQNPGYPPAGYPPAGYPTGGYQPAGQQPGQYGGYPAYRTSQPTSGLRVVGIIALVLLAVQLLLLRDVHPTWQSIRDYGDEFGSGSRNKESVEFVLSQISLVLAPIFALIGVIRHRAGARPFWIISLVATVGYLLLGTAWTDRWSFAGHHLIDYLRDLFGLYSGGGFHSYENYLGWAQLVALVLTVVALVMARGPAPAASLYLAQPEGPAPTEETPAPTAG